MIVNDDIVRRLGTLRTELSMRPNGVLVGNIPPGATSPASGDDEWDRVLSLADGGRFGSIDLFSAANLASKPLHPRTGLRRTRPDVR